MIPKRIHYCWFGGREKSELARKCISSWRIHLSDYEIFEWNEDNFDVTIIPFTKSAYQSNKFAYVSDYVRLWALYNLGGIYMDTDVEIMKPLDELLSNKAFMGYETQHKIGTGLIAAEAQNEFIKEFLDYYNGLEFDIKNLIPNVEIVSNMLVEKGFILENKLGVYNNMLSLYPFDYFTAKSYQTGKVTQTQNTFAIHHFSGSWWPWYEKVEAKVSQMLGIPNKFLLNRIVKKLNQ